jgi:hypothetical protein
MTADIRQWHQPQDDLTAAPSRDRALPADWSVRRGRDAYLDENGFTVEAYDEPKTPASFFGLDFTVPNTPKHRWAIMLHDLHHVATGYGTDLVGEAEISAWELRRGLSGLGLYVGSIVLGAALFGLVLAPRRTVEAFLAAPSDDGSLFQTTRSYEDLIGLRVGELRSLLGLPEEGLARRPRQLHPNAP